MSTDTILNLLVIGYRSSFFLGLLSLAIAKFYLPDFLQYGKTLNTAQSGDVMTLWDKIIHFTVPKSYFSHFYYLSAILSVSTLYVYPKYPVVWLLAFHSLRRLYETLFVCKYTSKSRMNWSHYVVGIWFYTVLHLILNICLYFERISPTINISALFILILASWDQYKNHRVLAHLRKYSLPTQRLFKIVCCPHYLDEMIIYSTFLSYNAEFIWPLIWVVVSLSISAIETKNFYKSKFVEENVPDYSIIPYIL
ncbi:hypothetical protein NCAS_0A13460 [Naumovozyma castellii]|uniref:Polyprenal reductase n=1 Tax=Naumovozyma castellii TaxID=27288 RepID=G0V8V5_NAUCA|nr:hypothetical protein NCAS_0A13460 [Naumovozyma castellii CBS 4309]CCC67904.1 hypothetical protein NCAS_0A13460 [Naumovozyma castellii CBS 4309]